jgi:opacity protein-like surface antigen
MKYIIMLICLLQISVGWAKGQPYVGTDVMHIGKFRFDNHHSSILLKNVICPGVFAGWIKDSGIGIQLGFNHYIKTKVTSSGKVWHIDKCGEILSQDIASKNSMNMDLATLKIVKTFELKDNISLLSTIGIGLLKYKDKFCYSSWSYGFDHSKSFKKTIFISEGGLKFKFDDSFSGAVYSGLITSNSFYKNRISGILGIKVLYGM